MVDDGPEPRPHYMPDAGCGYPFGRSDGDGFSSGFLVSVGGGWEAGWSATVAVQEFLDPDD